MLLGGIQRCRKQVLSDQDGRREPKSVCKPFEELLLDLIVADTLALVQLVQAFSHSNDKIDPLLNILPGSICGKLLNCFQSYFFSRHTYIIHNDSRVLQRFDLKICGKSTLAQTISSMLRNK